MALILPEIKHEYLFHLDTEETKNSVFDQCRAEGKEAAYSTFGTAQNDSEYQPAPTVEPDYYMQYCSSDGYDYLKDYRLVWGYGIGIIEQDVICSLTTGEHLAEGKEACDTYATENAAGENVDWKRGIWLKFSGNRNNSPARIGEVVLPDYIISLKDLCATLQIEDECNFDWFIGGTNILNLSNVCGQKNITVNIGADKIISSNVKDMSYAFANTTIGQDTDMYDFMSNPSDNSVDLNHCFYNAKVTKNVGKGIKTTSKEDVNITSMYENCTFYPTDQPTYLSNQYVGNSTFKNSKNLNLSFGFFDCQTNVDSCFEGCSINYTGRRTGSTDDDIVWAEIDFGLVNSAKRMFYKTSWTEVEVFLDLSSIVEHEDGCFDEFFQTDDTDKFFNVRTSNVKIRGIDVFNLHGNTITFINSVYYYDYDDNILFMYNEDENTVHGLINGYFNIITGVFIGTCIFAVNDQYNPFDYRENSNVVVKSNNFDDVENILKFYFNNSLLFPSVIMMNYAQSPNGMTVEENIADLNLDEYYFPTQIFSCLNPQRYSSSYSPSRNKSANINKENREFYILYDSFGYGKDYNITVNQASTIYMIHNRCKRYGYYDAYGDEDDYRINLINNSNNIINIYTYPYGRADSIGHIYKLYAPKCNIVSKEPFDWLNKSTKIEIKIVEINNIDITNFEAVYIYTLSTLNEVINNKDKTYNKDSIGSYGSSYSAIYVDSSFENKSITVRSNFVYNNVNLIPYIELRCSSSIKEVLLVHDNGEDYYQAVYANTNNFKYSDVIKGYIQTNSYNKERYMYLNCNNNIKTNTIDDLEEKVINYGDDNFSPYTYLDLCLNLDNYVINYNNIPSNGNLCIIQPNKTYGQASLNNCIINFSSKYKLSFIIGNIVSNNLTLNMGSFSYIRLEGDLTGTVVMNGNCDTIYSIPNGIENLTICKVRDAADLSLCSTLTQESINSIVNPTNFAGGCTLTINTIPFQYITEEQKQALVNAYVTLVEYIPQTE